MNKKIRLLFTILVGLFALSAISVFIIQQLNFSFAIPSAWVEKKLYVATGLPIKIKQAKLIWQNQKLQLKAEKIDIYKETSLGGLAVNIPEC